MGLDQEFERTGLDDDDLCKWALSMCDADQILGDSTTEITFDYEVPASIVTMVADYIESYYDCKVTSETEDGELIWVVTADLSIRKKQ